MSEDSNAKPIDTSPNGENTQYESVNTFNSSHARSAGQFGNTDSTDTEALTQAQHQKADREERKAENLRYGETLSEHGFGGETTGNSGYAQQQGYGRTEECKGSDDTSQAQGKQQYGKGSDVGA